MYSNGRSEEIIAKAIKQYNIPRHRLVIMTKCFNVINEKDGALIQKTPNQYQSKDFVNQFGTSCSALLPTLLLEPQPSVSASTANQKYRPVTRSDLRGSRCVVEAAGDRLHRRVANSPV